MVGSKATSDANRALIASTKSGLSSALEAESTVSKRSMMPRSLIKKR